MFVSLLSAGLLFVAYLGRSVLGDLDALSTARHDDIRWNMSQMEIETLNLDSAVHDAIHGHDTDLSAFRKRYDIYFSRVNTLSQSAFFELISQDPEAQAWLVATTDFLDETTPIVDGTNADLRRALPEIQARIEVLRPKVRVMSLAGIQVFALEDAKRRTEFSRTMLKLVASVIGLILILLLGLTTLLKLHRRGQNAAHDSQVVRSRFEAAISSSLDAVLIVDIHGKVVEFNGAAETVFGYSRAEALGSDMAELIVPEHMREMHSKGMARFLETGQQKVIGAGRVRLEGLRKSGKIFPVELSISLSEANGERVFVSYLRDITKELEAEEELRSARDKAQAGEKAKSDLLTVMSHEMRTPLNGILGSLALLDQDSFDERQKRHFNSISVSGELLLAHVNDVLDLSSLSTDATPREKVNFDLLDLLQQLADSLRANALERENKLTVTPLSADLGIVSGSKRSLQQCLVNLVGNAIKFTSNGQVAVEVERLNDSDLVEIRVSDTGVGIAPENLERIFDEFVTIDTAYARQNAGTGLGLAITKRLVEAMEGEIEADSLLGEGSLFTLRIPLPVGRSLMSKEPKRPGHQAQLAPSGQHALVVDDNEINRMILCEMLRSAGFSVEEAADGFEAIDRVLKTRFDIAFLDISMPGIDGIETLKRIRELDVAWRDLPAIAVTAHAARKDHDAIRKAPFSEILVKPVRPIDFQTKVFPVLGFFEAAVLPVLEDSGGDFKAQFGAQKYENALKDLALALDHFYGQLRGTSEPTTEIRRVAHKLSGSAAVLGKNEIHTQLQRIESCKTEEWDELKKDLA
ncbi:ATP-binding protein [Roseobacter sp. EG26]|uniref:hybrid sensor histidine kinase/response regulator n=1 Tax=Roseobacter sp. EG26 TaxID=3412477 RepID=UPI003CE5438C